MKMLLPLMLAAGMMFSVSLAAQAAPQTTPENPSRAMQQDSQPPSLASSVNRGEKNISGCLRQENGKFVLENTSHKKIWLSGPEDFAAHSGQTVILYGKFLDTSATNTSANADAKTDPHRSSQATDFQANRVEMVSASCKQKPVSSQNSDQR